jgi:hypothetical protein
MSDENERSVASAGSVADETDAYGVLRVGGSWVCILPNATQAETSRSSWDKAENWVHEVVPLYRKRPALTFAERLAMERAAALLEWTGDGAAIRGLLDRFE